MPAETLILVADAARARLFAARRGAPWLLVQAFEHPRSAMKAGELMADRPGRVHQSSGDGNRSAADYKTDPKVVEAQAFARELADALDTIVARRNPQRVGLVAPPKFLGELRGVLSTPVRAIVSGSIDSDLTGIPEHELPGRLAALV